MKNLRVFLILLMVLLPALACKAVTGGSNQIEEDIEPTDIPTEEVSLPASGSGGIITRVTLARGSTPEDYEPVDPTTEFGPQDTIHAIVTVKQAPTDTKFTVKWLITDVGDAAEPNYVLDVTETVQTGSGNMDFTLTPKSGLAVGSYRVEIYVNDVLDRMVEYAIAE